jgi:hydroxyethylthiazole kinase
MTTAILLDKDYFPMLISPPFLPKRDDKESDEAYVRRSMIGDAPGAGAFPVSYQSRWHGGLHLTPPFEHNVDLEIRAIADGVLVHRGDISTKSDDPNHPLNYAGGWTSDGCIVLKHSTEIGEGENGKVEFYSIYHHLRHMPPAILAMKIGDKVWRKDPIGSAGYINDKPYLFHFEIIADDANARKLMGRIQGDVPLSDDGRKDVCYGDLHFYLPASTTFSDFPTNPHGVRPTPRDVAGPGVALFVSMHFENGHCTMTTYREDGTLVGTTKDDELPGAAYEYQLYETATKLYPQQPAAGFELLRFGRVLGTADTLIPANAQHWRKVALPSAKLWVNLNGAGVVKLSDADFPHWLGWRMVDASDGDLRCKDEKTLALLAPEAPTVETNQVSDGAKIEANAQIVSSEVLRKQRLARTAVKFVTDWDYTTFERRLGWLKNPEPDGLGMNDTSFARLQKHSQAVSFWTQAKLGMDSTPWHFEPREFIIHFKKCGWLSLEEMAQLIPRRPGNTSWEAARGRFSPYQLDLNKCFRKYLISPPERLTQFLAQVYVETGLMRVVVEGNYGKNHVYGSFYGRGIMQLTWAGNYASYGKYRNFPPVATTAYVDTRNSSDPITSTSEHEWQPPTTDKQKVVHHDRKKWAPRYDPSLVATNPFSACDSGAYYWVTKHYTGLSNINRLVDTGFNTDTVGKTCVLINGGNNGYNERQGYAAYLYRFLSDAPDSSANETLNFTVYSISHGRWISRGSDSIRVDFTPQRP